MKYVHTFKAKSLGLLARKIYLYMKAKKWDTYEVISYSTTKKNIYKISLEFYNCLDEDFEDMKLNVFFETITEELEKRFGENK